MLVDPPHFRDENHTKNLNNTGKFLWPLEVSDIIHRKIPVLPWWGGGRVQKMAWLKLKATFLSVPTLKLEFLASLNYCMLVKIFP